MKQYRYNIEDFKIGDYENGSQKYLIFLIRYLFQSKDFNGIASRKTFLEQGVKYGFSEQELEQIFARGIKDNPAIRNILHRGKNTSLQLYSIKDKTQHGELYVYITSKLMQKVKSLSDFRSLSYIIIASRVFVMDEKVKKREYLKDLPGRSLTTIGKIFGNVSKSTMSKRLKRAEEVYGEYFKKIHRYTNYGDDIIQLTNIYSLKGVRYVYHRYKQTPDAERKSAKNTETYTQKYYYTPVITSKLESFTWGQKTHKKGRLIVGEERAIVSDFFQQDTN